VVVAVIAVRMVKMAVDQVVGVIAMRHLLVPATLGVGMTGPAVGWLGMTLRMPGVHRDHVLIDVIAVRMVKMALVEIVDVIVVAHRDMATPFPVDVRVIALMNRVRHAAEPTRGDPDHQTGNDETHSHTPSATPDKRGWCGR
jgi:hypothetical protein